MTSSERPSRCWRGRSTAGSTPLAPAVGGGHDAPHAGVALAGLQGGGDDGGEKGAAQPAALLRHQAALAAHQIAG